ncbi:MAG: transcriptional regulator [Chloroflexota bacterium]
MPNTRADVEAVSLLAEPVRGALYEWVVNAGRAVSRHEAAGALGITRALAAFHLDRLAGADLLAVEYRRLSGRCGPGAGRPSKLYRPATRDVSVSLPGRRYETAAALFARTIEQSEKQLPPDALSAAAREMGKDIGSAARPQAGKRPSPTRLQEVLLATLAERDYQPKVRSGEIRLENCPFQRLVDEHRPLICGMNLALIEGLISGLGARRVAARTVPPPERCCVAIASAGTA